MKDHSLKWKSGPIYKEVVIIGNGPSGLALSYILSGRWPYYNGKPHPDPMLTLRLQSLSRSQSILEQDLGFLAQGVEGRGSSAVGTLLDAMVHPGADQGLDLDPLLEWRCHKRIDHVVIGKGPPGGVWQAMDSNILTLSLSSWMELPGMRFEDWEKDVYARSNGNRRVKVSKVAKYYQDYVQRQRLGRYMRRGVVTSVIRQHDQMMDDVSDKKINWKVQVQDSFGRKTCYYARYVVLATGTNDCPNRLGISGESFNWVHHDLTELETRLIETKERGPLLIVGAGLSASDAVLAAKRNGCDVYHVFRRPNYSVGKMLPPSVYPEYYKIQEMMLGKEEICPGYTPFPGYGVLEISEQLSPKEKKLVRIGGIHDTKILEVGSVAVLIGSKPNLDFIKYKGLGVNQGGIDSKSNPIDVDPLTYELRSQPYMYALGPITGDILVRYILGGVTAAAAHINTALNS